MQHIQALDLHQYLAEIAIISHASASALQRLAQAAPPELSDTLTLLYAAAETINDKAQAARQALTP